MKIDFEGRPWQVELTDTDMRQADVIAGYTGLSLLGWYNSLLDTGSVAWNKSVRCLYWLIRDMNGEPVPIDANFAPLKLFEAFMKARDAEGSAAEAEEDPTKPAGEPAAGVPSKRAAPLPG